jgi:SAM-dependent methyltransferase
MSAPCYVCGGPCQLSARQATFRYYRCDHCLTEQLLPQPSQQTLDLFYDSFHAPSELGGLFSSYEPRMAADFPCKAKLVRARVPRNGLLLDVGCGKGDFLLAAAREGLSAEGLDLSTTAIAEAKTRGLSATAGDLAAEAPLHWREHFDAITLWATIEHLPDPRALLRNAQTCLRPGGHMFLDTGLGGSRLERILPGYSQWHDAPQHLFVFSSRGLETLLEQAGLTVLTCDRNFERSIARRTARYARHVILCCTAGALALGESLLSRRRFSETQLDRKWPIGRLLLIVAKKTTP